MAETSAASSIESPACDHCAVQRVIMMEMVPGKDKKAWWLCGRCWVDGIKSMHLEKPPKETDVVSHEMGEALKKSGWKVETVPADTPKKPKRRSR